mgnify:CR=1 FL=1
MSGGRESWGLEKRSPPEEERGVYDSNDILSEGSMIPMTYSQRVSHHHHSHKTASE